jgi:hypothetical protein
MTRHGVEALVRAGASALESFAPKRMRDMAEDSTAEGNTGDLVEVDQGNVLDADEEAEVLPFAYSITAYGADFDVLGLVRRLESQDILIPTFDPEVAVASGMEGFQRGFVWKSPQIHRFVESLLLGLPVPGIFLVREPNDVLLVLDGQQRLRSLLAFYEGVLRGKEFRLQGVQERFENLTYKELDDEDRRRLDNSIIHATIVRQDFPSQDQSSIYLIFERLNTGGTALTPQQVRVALFRGSFLGFLRELNENEDWRTVFGRKSEQLKDQELILRFFALLETSYSYKQPMKGFLNKYMGENRDLPEEERETLRSIFNDTVAAIHRGIGPRAFRLRTAVNAALLDSLMVGVARRLQNGPITDLADLKRAYDELLRNDEYMAVVQRTTANEERVRARLALASEAFADVP